MNISLSDKELTDTAILAIRENPFLLIEDGYLSVKNKQGDIVPLEPNYAQRHILDKIKALWFDNKPIRMYFLKARQLGISTLIEAIVYSLCSQISNIDAMVICSNSTNTGHLFDISKRYHEELYNGEYTFFTSKLVKDSETEIEFSDSRSKIMVLTAGNRTAGRGYTYQIVHSSEISSWNKADETFTAINQCIPLLPRTLHFIETTAKGVGNYAHTLWKQIEMKQDGNIFEGVFLPWFINPEYSMEIHAHENFALSNEEEKYREKYKITFEQMKWRRWCIITNCEGKEKNFIQEYPACADEAFISTGNAVFDNERLGYMYEASIIDRDVYKKYYVKDYKDFHRFELGEGNGKYGDMTIYDMPRANWGYVVTCDIAEGVGGDASVCNVFNVKTLEQVLHYTCDIDPALFAKNVYMIASLYNNALIVPERNNHGHAFILMLSENLHYGNIYKFKADERLGFPTMSGTKIQAINFLVKFIREGYFVLHNQNTISEMMSFTNNNGKYTGQSGCHDDEVTTMWLVAYIVNEGIFDSIATNVPDSRIENKQLNSLYYFNLLKTANSSSMRKSRTGY